jgi:ABC-type phosphate/phosphonate transport system substrate-binding protein
VGAVGAAASAQNELVFAVTEGVTYQATPKEIRDKFAPVADAIARATGRKVRTVLVPAYNDARAGLAKQEFDVAYIHPAHVSMAEIKAGRYKAVAWTSGFTEYMVTLLIPKDSPLKTLEDLKGRTLVTPDPTRSPRSWCAPYFAGNKSLRSTQRNPRRPRCDHHDPLSGRRCRSTSSILRAGGATAANAVVRGWTDKGGKILYRSKAVPIKQIVVSSKMSADEQQKIRDALLNLRDPKALEIVGYKGFVPPNPEVESAAIAWLGL